MKSPQRGTSEDLERKARPRFLGVGTPKNNLNLSLLSCNLNLPEGWTIAAFSASAARTCAENEHGKEGD